MDRSDLIAECGSIGNLSEHDLSVFRLTFALQRGWFAGVLGPIAALAMGVNVTYLVVAARAFANEAVPRRRYTFVLARSVVNVFIGASFIALYGPTALCPEKVVLTVSNSLSVVFGTWQCSAEVFYLHATILFTLALRKPFVFHRITSAQCGWVILMWSLLIPSLGVGIGFANDASDNNLIIGATLPVILVFNTLLNIVLWTLAYSSLKRQTKALQLIRGRQMKLQILQQAVAFVSVVVLFVIIGVSEPMYIDSHLPKSFKVLCLFVAKPQQSLATTIGSGLLFPLYFLRLFTDPLLDAMTDEGLCQTGKRLLCCSKRGSGGECPS